jgi:hypothetical protein
MRINVLRFGSLSFCRVGYFDDLRAERRAELFDGLLLELLDQAVRNSVARFNRESRDDYCLVWIRLHEASLSVYGQFSAADKSRVMVTPSNSRSFRLRMVRNR